MKPSLLDIPSTPSIVPESSADLSLSAELSAIAPAPTRPTAAPRDAQHYWTVVGSHVVVDIYPIFWATLVLALRRDLDLDGFQVGTIYAASAVVSGLPQGLAAWASDKFDTRLAGPIGLLFSAVCMSSIGWAQNFWQLLILTCIAQTGNGIYHPIAAALSGEVGGRILRGGRALAVSIFFAAGMIGSIIGPLAAAWVNTHYGLNHLGWLMIPGIITAAILFRITRGVRHRAHNHREIHNSISREEHALRWRTVWTLFTANCLRFIVNTALFVLFPIWATSQLPGKENIDNATSLNSHLIIAMTIGMGAFALTAARLVRQGHERRAIFFLSILGAIFTALTGFAGTHLGLWAMYVCAGLSGLGFAAILPITIALAQRLLPGRTGLASSLMLGVAWSTAALAPLFSMIFLGWADLKDAAELLPRWRIDLAFVGFGAILLVAGSLALAMPQALLRRVAEHR
jgi:MFS transporter, FSR family, fosmidomycin resistance protein